MRVDDDSSGPATALKRFPRGAFGDLERLGRRKRLCGLSLSVILPARQVADTIGTVLREVTSLRELPEPLVDQVVVVVADCGDDTADVARGFDAEVFLEADLLPGFGPNLGKGDALWRGLSVARGDLVVFADTDSRNFTRDLVVGVAGPMLTDHEVRFVKGAFRRPFTRNDVVDEDAGGRVTELCAKPLLNLFFPALAQFAQPLAGEFGAHRGLLNALPFVTGYGVDVGLLIDAAAHGGFRSLAEADLGQRVNRHQSLHALSRMAYAVSRTILDRAQVAPDATGRFLGDADPRRDHYVHAFATPGGLQTATHHEPLLERPPLAALMSTHGHRPVGDRRAQGAEIT